MRTITWKVVLTDDNKIGTIEDISGLPANKVESHLIMVGILENLKNQHLQKLNTLFERTVNKRDNDLDL